MSIFVVQLQFDWKLFICQVSQKRVLFENLFEHILVPKTDQLVCLTFGKVRGEPQGRVTGGRVDALTPSVSGVLERSMADALLAHSPHSRSNPHFSK